jgi:predicted phosphodiesterase
MVQIQIVSDLHLEFREANYQKILKPTAPILFLLGDICACGTAPDFKTYMDFIRLIATQFTYIFHVPGNHEYYTSGNNKITHKDTMPGIDAKIRNFLKEFKNIFYLNNNTVRLKLGVKTYVFIGTTLWTGVRLKDQKKVQCLMNDYTYLYVPNPKTKDLTADQSKLWKSVRKYNVYDMGKLHIKAVKYLVREIKKVKPSEIGIVLTHHKPYRSKDIEDVHTQAYETAILGAIIKKPPNIVLWGYGHTHVKDDTCVSDVRVISNPKGYPSQRTKYIDDFVVNV